MRSKFKLFELAKIKQTKIVSKNFSNLYNEGVAVVVQPPSRRIIRLNIKDFEDLDYKERKGYIGNFFLSFPTVYFRIQYCYKPKRNKYSCVSLHVVFANGKNALIPPLPNIGEEMEVCIQLPSKMFSNVDDLCNAVITKFWATEFNFEIIENYLYYGRNSLFGDFRKWQAKTKANPNWIPNRGLKSLDLEDHPIFNFSSDFFYGESFKKDIFPEEELDEDDDDDW